MENLLLLDQAQLRLTEGLNVVTGETGAGKTLLAHALDLLLGGRARKGIVRKGAAEAYVEGIFTVPPELAASPVVPPGAQELVLARRVWPDGRTRAYVCGRSATVADLQDLGGRLLAFYGQHEHRKLALAASQLEILDSHCGPTHLGLRVRVGEVHEQVRGLRNRAAELSERAGARERELDLLRFELEEIEAAGPSQEEESLLTAERERLRHLEALAGAAGGAAQALSPDGEGGAVELLAGAARTLEGAEAIDPALGPLFERLEALRYEADDAARELRDYVLGIEASPGRLEEVEERLGVLARLQRKHGGSITAVLEHAEHCRTRIAELDHAEGALQSTEEELRAAEAELRSLAADLSASRHAAAPELARAVRTRLAELAMPDAKFEVVLGERADGCGPRGADTVELMIAAGAGVSAASLRDAASGGELSRVMLALLSVAHAREGGGAREAPLLVFDEIDAGIGGHTAHAVGEHLRALATGRQVLCITHLPQVAALAARHFTIVKDTSVAPARTTVSMLDQNTVVGELVRMLGGGAQDRAAHQHARQLLRKAA